MSNSKRSLSKQTITGRESSSPLSQHSKPSQVRNDKGAISHVISASSAPAMSVLLGRRSMLLLSMGTALSACTTTSKQIFESAQAETAVEMADEQALNVSAQTLIRWGDPLWSTTPNKALTALKAEDAKLRFGYNNDFITFLSLPLGSESSDHGLLVVNHEYPVPHLMFKGLHVDAVPNALTQEQIAASMEAVGLSVLEVKQSKAGWEVLKDSKFNRRITATSPIRLSGPAAGHRKMQTSADPQGHVALGTHDNCNGGVTPWGTVLSGEEGSQDFFGGDISKAPDYSLLERYHYDEIKPTGEFGWPRFDSRFDISREPNEPNRFEWVVEVDPFDPQAIPVKRTALGRFAHEGAHCVLAPDGRVVIYMGDDWEFEYCYKFVTAQPFNAHDRLANKDLLDDGILYVAHFEDNGSMQWRPLVFGQGPLSPANGFEDQGDVLIQTRRAADLLGATPMDSPEGYMPDPATGKVYIALTGNDERTPENVDSANPRGPNTSGHMLELSPPDNGNGPDHSAERFDWLVRIICDEDSSKAAGFHPETQTEGYFFAPDNINFDPQGNMWICSDGPNSKGEDGLWVMPTKGPQGWLSCLFYRPPQGAECCGPAFTPDGKTLFLSIQHPGGKSVSIAEASTRWPDFKADEPPRPSVIVINLDT